MAMASSQHVCSVKNWQGKKNEKKKNKTNQKEKHQKMRNSLIRI